MTTAPDTHCRVLDLYNQALYLQAYTLSQTLGPLEQWEGPSARLLAGRLAGHLGARRLANRQFRRAWREDRANTEARYYCARLRLERSGPLAAWEALRRQDDLPEAAPELRGMWFALRAIVAAHLRDFDAADAWIARAEEFAPDDPWICVERAQVLEMEDRYEPALEAARRSLSLHPWHRAGVQVTAHALQLLGRDEEALELLAEAAERLESAAIVAQLTLLHTEMSQWEEARRCLDHFEHLSPLMEPEIARWLTARRSDVAYQCGDLPQALEYARQAADPFHQKIADRLEIADWGPAESDNPQSAIRSSQSKLLPVGFVRQHHMTCAPATLSAISRFWSMPAAHLTVAEEICYDGTPDHSERSWAEKNGWATREFTVTWESAVALLDRGVPFTLTTADPVTAHLQAVIGYDALRRTLLVRDPFDRHHGEFLADELLERLRSTGPRGMALVPREQAGLLDELELPDTVLYDQHHLLQRALLRHDRAEAQRITNALGEAAPDHRLTLQARRSLAAYDSDSTELLAVAERLLELFPGDGGLSLLKLSCLHDLVRRDERLDLLKQLCEKDTHPVFWQQYAQELSLDAREHPAALRLLRRAIRAHPGDAGSVYLLARLLWEQRRFEDGLRLFRVAACLDDKNEAISQAYFFASRHLKQAGTTLQFLQSRFRRFGGQSSQPARTLFWALSEVGRTTEAFQVLDEALRLRPEDGELQLFAAEAHSRHGNFDPAAGFLSAARGKCQRTAWLRTAAELALHRDDPREALSLHRQVVEAEPLDVGGQRSVAQLLAETESPAAALDYLRSLCARFPCHYGLHQLWIEWLREEESDEWEPATRRLIEINPADAWAHRELALALGQQQRFEEAISQSELSQRLDPMSPHGFCVHGQVCHMAGNTGEARQAFRRAIQLSVDTDNAIRALVATCDTPAERREALAFVEEELVRQTILGDGLLAFREQARQVLSPEELLATLRKALQIRPDLWHAWSAVTAQLIDMDRLDEALKVARTATARFPLLPRLWLDLARLFEARRDPAGEREALEQALRISPGWGAAVVQLASLYERTGEFDRARTLLEQAVARSPLDPLCHGWLAQVLWRIGMKEEALAQVERALELEPGYEWAWNSLRSWAAEVEPPPRRNDDACGATLLDQWDDSSAGQGRAERFARQLAERRAGEARSWLVLARMLEGDAALPERLAALDRAAELNPRCLDAYELKAELLAGAGRYEEALAACRSDTWGDCLPSALRARAAWVEAERGDLREAIAQMRALVSDDPHFYRGWAELARWCEQAGDHAGYRDAAQKLTRLDPQNPLSFAVLAGARLQAGDRPGAKAALRRAFELAPNYSYAGMTLLDMLMEDGELLQAGELLQRLRTHIGGEWVLAREVQLAARRGDAAMALLRLRELCVCSDGEPWPLHAAAQVMTEAGWSDSLAQVLEEALDRPGANPQVGALWMRSHLSHGDWRAADRLPALQARGAIGTEATGAYLECLGEAGRVRPLRLYLEQHGARLREDTKTWASAGQALVSIGDNRRAALWLSDWRNRSGVEPWMLSVLVVALRLLRRDGEAASVSRHALTLEEDGATGSHAIWLAVEGAAIGQWEEAARLLSRTDPEALNPYYRFLHALAAALDEVHQAEDRQDTFTRARARLKAAAPLPADWGCAALRRAHRRLVFRIAAEAGGSAARLWAWFQVAQAAFRGIVRAGERR